MSKESHFTWQSILFVFSRGAIPSTSVSCILGWRKNSLVTTAQILYRNRFVFLTGKTINDQYSHHIETTKIIYNAKLCFSDVFRGHNVVNKAKGRISKRVFQESKARQFFRKTNISYPNVFHTSVCISGVRNVRFLEQLPCFVFLKHPFWDEPFGLFTDYKNGPM